MDIRAEKRALRRAAVAGILAMDPAERRRQEAALAERLPGLPGFAGAGVVLLYANAFPEEIATGPLLRAALEAGKRLACPRVDRAARRLRLFRVADPAADLVPGTLGIPEPRPELPELAPDEVDWALVPGLAFDARGFRLGRGAGHYDRLLTALRPDAQRWALILEPQWVDALPVEPHDQPLDGVASAALTRSWPRGAPR
jgi:5-formyltetrahydrofolate cyclo-ligase